MNIKQIILTIILSVTTLFSQTISTQGVLRDANGYALTTAQYNLTFRIYDSLTGGVLKWTGVYANHPVTNGVFNAILGDYANNPINMLDGDGSYWLSIQIASDGEMSPRLDLNISPYEMAYLTGSQNVFPEAANVGIGTTNPNFKLHVKDTYYPLYLESAYGYGKFGAANSQYFHFFTNLPKYYFDKGLHINGGLYADGNAEINGNMGIGTANPSNKLTVTGDADFTGKVGIGTADPSNKLSVDGDADFTGNVGIGTSDSDYKLAVASNTADVLQLSGGNSGSSTLDIKNYTSNDDDGQWYFDPGTGGQIVFGTTSGSTQIEKVKIEGGLDVTRSSGGYALKLESAGGYCNFGALNPSYFHFNTNRPGFYFYQGITTAGGITASGNIETNGRLKPHTVQNVNGSNEYDLTWDATSFEIRREGSSRRYKQNINEWDDHRNILNANVKTYQMKAGFGDTGQNQIGLIAEELHDLGLNQLVVYDKENRPDAVKYKKVSLYLLEVVKEQNKEINEMKSRLAALESAMAKLK